MIDTLKYPIVKFMTEHMLKDLSHFEHPAQFQLDMKISIFTSFIFVFAAKILLLQIHLCRRCGLFSEMIK